MRFASLCRWIGRLAATAMAALFVTFLIGEGTPDPRALTDRELLGFAAVFIMLLGTLAGWVREVAGGLLILVGYGAFAAIENGWPPLPFGLFLVAGVLLLSSALLRRFLSAHRPRSKAADPPLVPGA